MPCKTLAILLSGLNYKKDNGYLFGIIGVSGIVPSQTQLNDALIACCIGKPAFEHEAQMGLAAPIAMGLEFAIESLEILAG